MPWIHSDSQEEDSEEDDEEGDEDDEDDDEEDDEEDDASVESSEPRAYSVLSDIRGEEPGDLSVQVHNTVCPGTQHCLSRYTTISVQVHNTICPESFCDKCSDCYFISDARLM